MHKDDGESSIYLVPIIRKSAFNIGACAMAVLLAEAKPFITESNQFAQNRFTTFVENNLCGNFSL